MFFHKLKFSFHCLVVLLVADFKAETRLEEVSGSHSVGSNVEAVAGTVRGLDEISVVHVLVDSRLDVGLADTGNVGSDSLQRLSLTNKISLSGWVGVLLVELENGLVLSSLDLVFFESLPHSFHFSLHLVENTHSSGGDFDVTVSTSVGLWHMSVHAEETAVRVGGKLTLEGNDVFGVQVSGVAALFDSSDRSLSRVELHKWVGRVLSMLDGVVVLASDLGKDLEDSSLSRSVRAGDVETKSEPAVFFEIVTVLELVSVELAGLVGSNSASIGGDLASDSAEFVVVDVSGADDGEVGTGKGFSSEGEDLLGGGLVDTRGGSVGRGGETREHEARHVSVVLADNLFVSSNGVESRESMSSISISDSVSANGRNELLSKCSGIARDGGAEDAGSLPLEVRGNVGVASLEVVERDRSVESGLGRGGLVARATARDGTDDSEWRR